MRGGRSFHHTFYYIKSWSINLPAKLIQILDSCLTPLTICWLWLSVGYVHWTAAVYIIIITMHKFVKLFVDIEMWLSLSISVCIGQLRCYLCSCLAIARIIHISCLLLLCRCNETWSTQIARTSVTASCKNEFRNQFHFDIIVHIKVRYFEWTNILF
jgi:hypothetical protein